MVIIFSKNLLLRVSIKGGQEKKKENECDLLFLSCLSLIETKISSLGESLNQYIYRIRIT